MRTSATCEEGLATWVRERTSSCKRKAGEASSRLRRSAENAYARPDRAIPRYCRFRRAPCTSLCSARPVKLCASVLRRQRVTRHPTASDSPSKISQALAAYQHVPPVNTARSSPLRLLLQFVFPGYRRLTNNLRFAPGYRSKDRNHP